MHALTCTRAPIYRRARAAFMLARVPAGACLRAEHVHVCVYVRACMPMPACMSERACVCAYTCVGRVRAYKYVSHMCKRATSCAVCVLARASANICACMRDCVRVPALVQVCMHTRTRPACQHACLCERAYAPFKHTRPRLLVHVSTCARLCSNGLLCACVRMRVRVYKCWLHMCTHMCSRASICAGVLARVCECEHLHARVRACLRVPACAFVRTPCWRAHVSLRTPTPVRYTCTRLCSHQHGRASAHIRAAYENWHVDAFVWERACSRVRVQAFESARMLASRDRACACTFACVCARTPSLHDRAHARVHPHRACIRAQAQSRAYAQRMHMSADAYMCVSVLMCARARVSAREHAHPRCTSARARVHVRACKLARASMNICTRACALKYKCDWNSLRAYVRASRVHAHAA